MKYTSGNKLAGILKISKSRGLEAVIKAQLISAVLDAVQRKRLTHTQIAKLSRLPRSGVTGILSGSLQRVTIDRILRLIEAVGLVVEIKVRKAA